MKNKNLLITGAATRIGKAIALRFSKKGWNIAIHYFKSSSKAKKLKKQIENNKVKVVLIKADLKKSKQVEKIIPTAKKKLGIILAHTPHTPQMEIDAKSAITGIGKGTPLRHSPLTL